MAGRDASKVQLDFPQLVADLIRQLRLTGTVGVLDMLDQVRPVYIVAQREGALSIVTSPPLFNSAAIFQGGVTNPAANTNILDSGPLPAGDYDLFASINIDGTMATASSVQLEHRNAADAATLSILLSVGMTTTFLARNAALPLIRYTLALNERVRLRVPQTAVGRVNGTLGIIIVPTP